MNEEKRLQKRARERQREIKLGIRLELLDTIPEKMGEQLVAKLNEALKLADKKVVLKVLKKIGDTIHARWGFDKPTEPVFDNDQGRYVVGLSTQTGGTRLFINTKSHDQFPGDLIFPNVNLNHKQNGRTLADVFEELFSELAENIQQKENPYYVVKTATVENKK